MSSAARFTLRNSERRAATAHVPAWNVDIAAAVIELTAAFVEKPRCVAGLAHALDCFRERVQASEAVFWSVAGTSARRVLHAGTPHSTTDDAVVELSDGAIAIERLRRNGIVLCRFDEVSGLEDLVPAGLRSFAAAAALNDREVIGALVIGWPALVPPCDKRAVEMLRVAATLFAATEPGADWAREASVRDEVFDSISERIAVVDEHGVIVDANRGWSAEAARRAIAVDDVIARRVTYREILRRLAGDQLDAAGTFAQIMAVCTGAVPSFQTAYASHAPASTQWCVLTVRPLGQQRRGAVIVHSDVTASIVTSMADRMSADRSHRFADTVPLPVWIMTADGHLIFGNPAWREASGARGRRIHDAGRWIDAIHPDDRAAASAALQSVVAQRERFNVELRLQAADGTYRWWSMAGVPRCAPDGRVETVLGVRADVTAARSAQHSLRQLGVKLLAAQEGERRRIARELHDDLGQQMALLASKLAPSPKHDRRSVKAMQVSIAEAWNDVQEIAASLHNLAHLLHPTKLQLFGLVHTLETLCRDVANETGLHVNFEAQQVPSHLSEDTALCVFRVAQEALQNAVKHSGARTIGMRCAAHAAGVLLQVSDDGAGFSPQTLPSVGLGLRTMRERVELVGGTLSITMRRPHGTIVEALIPITSTRGE